jgi:hypothetical protein
MDKFFRKGDKVEIIGNIPFVLKDKPRPLLGRITFIDGAYIYVKPLGQRWEGEWYPCELKHINNETLPRYNSEKS